MTLSTVTFDMDSRLKSSIEDICDHVGMSLPGFITSVVEKVVIDKKPIHEILDDPFYTEENLARLRKAVADVNAGRKISAHELIDADA